MSLGDCKLKQKSKTLTPPNADKNVEQQELWFIVGGDAKWYSHFGRYSFLHNETNPSHIIQQLYILVFLKMS
jgi:hypothetical protein